MKIELHILQNFAPSNLNRDDTGAPKDCEFGGHRRARISSQCQKRAVREAFRIRGLLAEDELGVRTKRLVHQVTDALVERHGHERAAAAALALGAIEGIGLKSDAKKEGEDGWKTQYLLFVPTRIGNALADVLHEHRDALAALTAAKEAEGSGDAGKRVSKKNSKKAAKADYPKEVKKQVEALMESASEAVDLALFGRMIADQPKWNVEASCQVAHAISTNRVQMDFDFFTAVDDFKPADTAGSDMMGTIQFNSSCFYRYAVLDVDALSTNLGIRGTELDALVQKSVRAFVRAFLAAIPSGKQNGMAAHNFPSYVLGVVRDGGQPVSLSNAFLKPARPRDRDEQDLVDDSIAKLEEYFARMREVIGDPGQLAVSWADRDLDGSRSDLLVRSEGLEDFFTKVTARVTEASA